MLKVQYYSWEELQDLLSVQFTKKNGRVKLINRNIMPFYEYEIVKDGRKSVGLNIKSIKEKQKSKFIQLCEEVAGFEVNFPNEETAEKLLRVLKADDKTIFSYEELGKFEELGRYYTRQTISIYMRQFQEIGIIPKRKQLIKSIRFNAKTGELLGKAIDPNKWTYYKVYKNERNEITYLEYKEMLDYIRVLEENMILPFIDEAEGNVELINHYRKECKKQSIFACIKEYGYLPKRALSKALTAKAQSVFENYFPNENVEESTVNNHNIQSIYNEDVTKNNTVVYIKPCTNSIENSKKENLLVKKETKHNIPFKELIKAHEFMQIQEVTEKNNEEEAEEVELQIVIDPFTGQLEAFNEKTQQWEKYVEDEWSNGKKVDIYIVPDVLQFKRNGKNLALEAMLGSVI